MGGMSDRIIRKGFWGSPDVAKCTAVQRLIYIGLWAAADDHGRGECNFKTLEGLIFPHDDLADLVGDPLATFGGQWPPVAAAFDILTYQVNGHTYYQIQGWERHQRLRKGRQSQYPDPTSGNIVVLTSGGQWRPVAAKSRPEVEVEVEVEEPPTVVGGCQGVASSQASTTPPVDNPWPVDNPGVLVAVPNAASKLPAQKTKRGTRLSREWTPDLNSPANKTLHDQHDPAWLSEQLARFRDYWTSKTGQQATKVDWDATWRNWLRRSADQEKPRQTPEAARIQAMYADASTRDVSIFQQIIDADDARRRQAS